MRPGGRPLVVEFAGLPGAGKTSLVDALSIPHADRRKSRAPRFYLGAPAWLVLFAALRLALSIRPLRLSYVARAVRLATSLRRYVAMDEDVIVLDQGLVQKIWSMVVETETFSRDAVADLVTALGPFAPDHVFWVKVPERIAAQRISRRGSGNSRFDGLAEHDIERRLLRLEETYAMLLKLFGEKIHVDVSIVDGTRPIQANADAAEQIISILLNRSARS